MSGQFCTFIARQGLLHGLQRWRQFNVDWRLILIADPYAVTSIVDSRLLLEAVNADAQLVLQNV